MTALLGRLAVAVPALAAVLAAPVFLRSTLSVYDGGLFLTLARFTDLQRLPYRDLWTLYGPGPPVLSSIVMDVFGPGLGPQRIALLLVNVLVAAAVYLLARRYVPSWTAGVLSAFVLAVEVPFHFEQTMAFLLWGLWFALRASADEARAPRRLSIAALLFGLSFWGRFEFVVVGVLLVLGLWYFSRGRVEGRSRILAFGLVPPALFLVYLLAVVGWERAWLNLVDYPFFRYSDAGCRGLPAVWSTAFTAMLAPFRGEPWSRSELLLWTATFLAPILGVLSFLVSRARKQVAPLEAFVAAGLGVVVIFLWLELRPRASGYPHPLVPMMAVSAAVLLGALTRRRERAGRWAQIVVAGVIVLTLATSWVPRSLWSWSGWPPYDSMLGWEGGRMEGLYDERVWSEVASVVQARTAPGEEIFVALTDNSSRHHANAPIFYWFTDRPPASRFIEFDPCLTDTEPVQRAILGELAAVDVVITTTFFPDTRRAGPTILDDYLGSRFDPVHRGELPQEQAVLVLERRP
jgi:hypothetical protein